MKPIENFVVMQIYVKNAMCPVQIRIWVWWFIIALNVCVASVAATNSISAWLTDGTINWGAWGTETNGFCAGINTSSRAVRGKTARHSVTVYVLTSKTNTQWNYLALRDAKFSKFELRDPSGAIVVSLPGRRIDRDLRDRIPVNDLPRARGTRSSGNMPDSWLLLSPGSPAILAEICLQDVYHIRKEGDYTLTICPAIYEFTRDRKAVLRIALPCVDTKMHLSPDVGGG